ncbi:class I adenylate-forming enzyme family protein [Halorussus halophilus]|uniref:class I adenylate-forming enzyme family protein n=1 Tax=Halorussus halophilus TaxID=2650975 RepID=UPI001300F345|nr:AMP-binding protein [Halorussus halophilus]
MHVSSFPASVRSGNVARLYAETARTHPDRLAVEMGGRSLTHAEYDAHASRFAGGLRELGLDPGDRLALYAPNSSEYLIGALGALKAGTPFTPMDPKYQPREIRYQLRDSDARAVVTHADLRERLGDALETMNTELQVVTIGADRETDSDAVTGDVSFAEVDSRPLVATRCDEDVAMQPYTSGTTGDPKGVLLTHENLRAQSLMGFEKTNLPAERERFLSVLPLSHISGFVNRTWQPLVRGGSVYLRDPAEWDPESAMADIEEHDITKFGAVTAMYVDIVNHESFGDYDLSSLEEAMEGGTKMPTAVQEQFEDATGVGMYEAYGLTEAAGATHFGFDAMAGPKLGTIGQPHRATSCKVVDDDGNELPPGQTGELLIRGPNVMQGYHDKPDATDEAFTETGYLRTGDVVRCDEDNYYEILDRKSSVIVTGGYNVYPAEVENVLYDHPAVVDAAVVGVPDERRNETVKAFVVPESEIATTEEELRAHCLDQLAAYKHPREIELVKTLPRTTSGKVKKFELNSD